MSYWALREDDKPKKKNNKATVRWANTERSYYIVVSTKPCTKKVTIKEDPNILEADDD